MLQFQSCFCEMATFCAVDKRRYYTIWSETGLCNSLTLQLMDEIAIHLEGKVIVCGDFNAHSSLRGHCNNENGSVMEELMEIKNMACFNDGIGTIINIRNGTESAIDLTIVSDSLAGLCSWNVIKGTTIGSDHYPIVSEVGVRIEN